MLIKLVGFVIIPLNSSFFCADSSGHDSAPIFDYVVVMETRFLSSNEQQRWGHVCIV